jgi:hypothetical protein
LVVIVDIVVHLLIEGGALLLFFFWFIGQLGKVVLQLLVQEHLLDNQLIFVWLIRGLIIAA